MSVYLVTLSAAYETMDELGPERVYHLGRSYISHIPRSNLNVLSEVL